MKSTDLRALLKRVFEIAGPDLRAYYRVTRKARVVATYASDGSYWADVQPLRNDETADDNEPVIRKVEIPVIWAGPERGVVCPPVEGALCDLSYYDGDPNYPRISNFRWLNHGAPVCGVGGFIIQLEPGVSIAIDPERHIITLTDQDARVTAGGKWTIQAGVEATVDAPVIRLNKGTGVVTGECICHFTGKPHGDVSATVMAGK
ncbi:MAG: baseplate assembly protein [Desulfovibrio desulfuricans]|jgi:hypothetical protein|nr:baseplate assembly protein [Desulfovibrio desulfuricans]